MSKNKETTWVRLDNAGKIFPPTSNKRDTKVFRFSCELFEEIDEGVLQIALNSTMKSYPLYQSVLKKGLFWYYLESSSIKPIARAEYKPPCSPLYIHNKKSLLFEVTYHQKRINVEVYHALSDGTGALLFLKTLATNYLMQLYPKRFDEDEALFDPDASRSQKMDDSFDRYFSKEAKKKMPKRVISHVIKTPMLSENRLGVIEGSMPLDAMLKLAKLKNVSLTVLVTSVFLCSVNDIMLLKEKKRPVVAVVPVNLRNYFASESVRNFFGVINVGYDFGNNPSDIDSVIQSVSDSFKRELSVEQISVRMASLSALENNVFARPVPLFLKDLIMSVANKRSDKEKTISISNIGRIDMPEQLSEYIKQFCVFVSTKMIQICMCSYANILDIAFSSAYVDTDIQMHFFRYFSNLGIPIEVNQNILFDEDVDTVGGEFA